MFMLPAPLHLPVRILLRALRLALIATQFSVVSHAQSNEILPLDQVRAGMQGYAYTIFAGDQVEKFDLEVIGVMPNFLGPRQSIILVQLKGPKVERTGVVAGMSGSPVYLDGKLAGALSLKLGIFTKDPIAGVTPIEDVVRPRAQTGAQQFPLPLDTSAVQKPAQAFSRENACAGFCTAEVSSGNGNCCAPVCARGRTTSSIGVTPAMGSFVKMPSLSESAPASLPSR